jgi:hypothetical protein
MKWKLTSALSFSVRELPQLSRFPYGQAYTHFTTVIRLTKAPFAGVFVAHPSETCHVALKNECSAKRCHRPSWTRSLNVRVIGKMADHSGRAV